MEKKPFTLIRELYPTPNLPLNRIQHIWSGIGRYAFEKPVRINSIHVENRSDVSCFVDHSIVLRSPSTWEKIKSFFFIRKRYYHLRHRIESGHYLDCPIDELLMGEDTLEIKVEWIGGIPRINDSLYLEINGTMFDGE